MRIIVMGLRGLPNIMGGVETHCEELLPRVKKLSPSSNIKVLGRSPYIGMQTRQFKGLEVQGVLSTRRQSVEALSGACMAVVHARVSGCDLLHIHAIGPGLLTLPARLLGLKVIVTHHGADYERAKWGRLARTMLRVGEALSVRFANRVICVSASSMAKLSYAYPRHKDKLVFIPNGVPTIEADHAAGDELLARNNLAPGSFILAVGRLVPEKGFDYLIDAVERLPEGIRLVVAGGADHSSAYETQLRQKASNRIVFLGEQPRAVILRLYEQARLFVLPSFHEGLPIAALEAGRAGTPIILSDIAANIAIGLPAHHYFPLGDADALSRKIAEPAERFGVDATWFRRQFDWDRIAEQTLAIYQRTIGSGHLEQVAVPGAQPVP